MNSHRRLLLKSALALAGLLAGLAPARARRFEAAFRATELAGALEALAADAREAGPAVRLELPAIPENSAQVSVTVSADLPDVRAISLLVEHNPWPLAWHVELPPGTLPQVSTRIKLRQSSRVLALVHTGGGVYRTQQTVEVVDGGCG